MLDAKEKREKGLQLKLANAQHRIQKCRTLRHSVLQEYRQTLYTLSEESKSQKNYNQGVLLGRLRGYRYEMRQHADTISSLEREKREIRDKLQEVARSRKLLEDHIDRLKEEKRDEYERRERKAAENYAIHSYSVERGE